MYIIISKSNYSKMNTFRYHNPVISLIQKATRHISPTRGKEGTLMKYLSTKLLLFESPHNAVADGSKAKRKLESDIATVLGVSNLSANRAYVPDLSHAHNRTEDAEAESCDSGEAGWELGRSKIVSRNVAVDAVSEEEVLRKGDSFVNGKPISLEGVSHAQRDEGSCPTYNQQHEIGQDRGEVRVSWNGNGNVDQSANESPDESGNTLSPSSKDLQGERDGVNVGAVVGNDGQCENDQAELSEFTQRSEEHLAKEATVS